MKRLSLFLALAAVAGCKGSPTVVATCTSDTECGPNFHCATSGTYQGTCLCSNDNACPQDAGQAFCNTQGLCQTRIGCHSNLDCPENQFCDALTGLCTLAPACGSDVDCPIGTICDPVGQTCIQGCHSNGDCPIDNPCVCSNGAECLCPPPDAGSSDPASFDRSTCEVGACRADTCANDTSMCAYNDTCVPGTDGGLSTCQLDPRASYLCSPCTESAGTSSACGPSSSPEANFCLIDLGTDALFCGADCSSGQSCPSGYICDDVIVLTPSGSPTCSSSAQCPRTGPLCDVNDAGTCPSGTLCLQSTDGYRCTGQCVFNEGEHTGFCTCVTDQDCPKDTCQDSSRRCSTSLQPCIPGQNDSCSFHIACVETGGARGCFIGRNCGPGHGLHCPLPSDK